MWLVKLKARVITTNYAQVASSAFHNHKDQLCNLDTNEVGVSSHTVFCGGGAEM